MNRGVEPVKSLERDKTGERFWTCPFCGQWVGGYVITGPGQEDWTYEEDRFCRSCGAKINWSGIK